MAGVRCGNMQGQFYGECPVSLLKIPTFAQVGRGNTVGMDLGISKEACDVNGLDSGPIIS